MATPEELAKEVAELKAFRADAEAKLAAAEKAKAEIVADRDNIKKSHKTAQEQLQSLAQEKADKEAKLETERQEREKEKLLKNGEFEKALAMEREKHRKEREADKAVVEEIVQKRFVPSAIKTLALKTGLNVASDALNDIPELFGKEFEHDETTPSGLKVKGKPDVDPQAHLTELLKTKTYLLKDTKVISTNLTTQDGRKQNVQPMTYDQIMNDKKAAREFKRQNPEAYKAVVDANTPKNVNDLMKLAQAKKK